MRTPFFRSVRQGAGIIVRLHRHMLDAIMLLVILHGDQRGDVELQPVQIDLDAAAGNLGLQLRRRNCPCRTARSASDRGSSDAHAVRRRLMVVLPCRLAASWDYRRRTQPPARFSNPSCRLGSGRPKVTETGCRCTITVLRSGLPCRHAFLRPGAEAATDDRKGVRPWRYGTGRDRPVADLSHSLTRAERRPAIRHHALCNLATRGWRASTRMTTRKRRLSPNPAPSPMVPPENPEEHAP